MRGDQAAPAPTGQSHAAPRTPLESPCRFLTTRVSTVSENTCCGKRGCIEAFLSGPGFMRDHERHTGRALASREIEQAAIDGEPAAAATMARYHDRLARSLATVIDVVDPDVIVLGGGMSNVAGLADAVTARLPQHVFSDTVLTRVVRNRHGDSSGVRGAAWLWPVGAGAA